jgi:hypothetical protein
VREQQIPSVSREIRVNGGKNRNEMIFHGTNVSFGGVRPMIPRGTEFRLKTGGLHCCHEFIGNLIVESNLASSQIMILQPIVGSPKSFGDGRRGAPMHRL